MELDEGGKAIFVEKNPQTRNQLLHDQACFYDLNICNPEERSGRCPRRNINLMYGTGLLHVVYWGMDMHGWIPARGCVGGGGGVFQGSRAALGIAIISRKVEGKWGRK